MFRSTSEKPRAKYLLLLFTSFPPTPNADNTPSFVGFYGNKDNLTSSDRHIRGIHKLLQWKYITVCFYIPQQKNTISYKGNSSESVDNEIHKQTKIHLKLKFCTKGL